MHTHSLTRTLARTLAHTAVQVSLSQAAARLELVAGRARCGMQRGLMIHLMISRNTDKLVHVSRQTLSAFLQTTL